jgi:hypothetical protein
MVVAHVAGAEAGQEVEIALAFGMSCILRAIDVDALGPRGGYVRPILGEERGQEVV